MHSFTESHTYVVGYDTTLNYAWTRKFKKS